MRYHTGSIFLIGSPRLEAEALSDEDGESLSAYIHAAAGSSTLAAAKVIVTRNQVSQNIYYLLIQSLKLKMQQGLSTTAALHQAEKMSGGALNGGIALRAGLITRQDLEAARMQAEDYADPPDIEEVIDEGGPRTAASTPLARRPRARLAARGAAHVRGDTGRYEDEEEVMSL